MTNIRHGGICTKAKEERKVAARAFLCPLLKDIQCYRTRREKVSFSSVTACCYDSSSFIVPGSIVDQSDYILHMPAIDPRWGPRARMKKYSLSYPPCSPLYEM
jgi:hypothetical protein